ncbi:MAG: phage tail protein [Hyphomicrobiales bacterium]
MNNADDHMRMIKGTLKATFPNFTSSALNSTQAQLDAAVAATTNGAAVLDDNGASFKSTPTAGLKYNTGASIMYLRVGGLYNTYVSTTGLVTDTLTANVALVGPGVVPIGGMIMWLTDTLPTVGVWCWANGGTLSRTGNGAALFAVTGSLYGAGDGSTTFNVINMQEAVPVGKSTMGGAGSPGLLTSISFVVKAFLGSLFGSDTHIQTIAEMPIHYHSAGIYDPQHSHSAFTVIDPGSGQTGGGAFHLTTQVAGTNTGSSATGVRVNSNNGLDTTYSAGSGAAFNITQPSRVVNFIIRIG